MPRRPRRDHAREASYGDAMTPPAVAILKSTDIAATLGWYREAGFKVRRQELTLCEVYRDGLALKFLPGETPWASPPG